MTKSNKRICTTIDDNLLKWVENERGLIPRSAFVNEIIKQECQRRARDAAKLTTGK